MLRRGRAHVNTCPQKFLYHSSDGTHNFRTLATTPAVVHDLIVEVEPQRGVIEVGAAAGPRRWVKDLCEALEVRV